MSAPVDPTATTIVTEGMQKAGVSVPTTAQVTRATTYWLEEIKNDIFEAIKKFKYLQGEAFYGLQSGRSTYSMPSDFSSDLSLQLMSGTASGTAQGSGSAANEITLASGYSASDTDILGQYILLYGGTGFTTSTRLGQAKQVVAWNNTTKVATVESDWDTSPDSTSLYAIIENEHPLDQKSEEFYKRIDRPNIIGRPEIYIPNGDEDYSEFKLYPVPYLDKTVYGARLKYYLNIQALDTAGTLIVTLYKRMRYLFVLGIEAKQLRQDDDDRASSRLKEYQRKILLVSGRETYGTDLHNLTARVEDY